MTTYTIPRAFVWRRVHSLMGLWLVLFLLEHLLTNSQAALLLGENGGGFVRMVNWIHDLPYLPIIELFLIGTPIALHGVLGIKYLFTSKNNAKSSDGSTPSLKEYNRNKAYSWQRITSWILLVGISCHVAKFRFIEYPTSINEGTDSFYFVKISMDKGLYTVADRLGVELYDNHKIDAAKELAKHPTEAPEQISGQTVFSTQEEQLAVGIQKLQQKRDWLQALTSKPISNTEVIAVTKSFGTASMMSVRDTFKSPIYVGLYTIFVLAACFHAFNGLWTFMISWGLIFKRSAQKSMSHLCVAIMITIAFLGLAAVWGTYWINLKY
ncbi:MAG: succinate dehydrogenase [Chlamydiia bacterium]